MYEILMRTFSPVRDMSRGIGTNDESVEEGGTSLGLQVLGTSCFAVTGF